MVTVAISDILRLMGRSVKSKKSGEKGSVISSKESIQMGCVSQDRPQCKVYSAGSWQIWII